MRILGVLEQVRHPSPILSHTHATHALWVQARRLNIRYRPQPPKGADIEAPNQGSTEAPAQVGMSQRRGTREHNRGAPAQAGRHKSAQGHKGAQ